MSAFSEQIRHRLTELAAQWGGYQGSERAEAQTFLNELLACYGVDRKAVGARFEEPTGSKFVDMVWPNVCIVEMKRPSEAGNLKKHREQALGYWRQIGTPDQPAPPWVVLCAFHRFEIWRPGEVYTQPLTTFDLAEIPENADALLFLAGEKPGFYAHDELTRDAVALLTELYGSLDQRDAADEDVLQDFILQSVWAMFAEDLGMIPGHLFTRLVAGLASNSERSSFDDLGQLFTYLAQAEPRPTEGLFAGTPFANGGLFTRAAQVHLEKSEVELLKKACDFDWTQVEPAIFGSLLQGALGKEKQWALGAHYTSEADIMKVVLPTIVDPWRERIAACATVADVQAAQSDLMAYTVLDPACGSGNFLYVAYRELRQLEAELRERGQELQRAAGMPEQAELALYPISNMRGIELEPFAVKLARVTMWIGHKLAVDRMGVQEQVLPLVDLSGIQQGDALRVEWPKVQAIVSNPPYHGSQRIRKELGDDYAEWLKAEFGIGLKDYAVYWLRKAHEQLEPEQRAGMVVTNSVSQNRSRGPGLQWIAENGGVITQAISKQPWSGEAVVNVSIVNWVREPAEQPAEALLDGRLVRSISGSLSSGDADISTAVRLSANRGVSFQGPIPGNRGFLISESEADKLLGDRGARYDEVIRPYLVAEDIASSSRQAPTRWIIDFGAMALEEAAGYPAALEIVRSRVKPERDRVRRKARRERWWRFAEVAVGMRKATAGLSRFAVGTRVGKRILFTWSKPGTCPGDATNIFAFSEDFDLGVLLSSIHANWAWAQSSTMRIDIRYTPTSAFEPFPWPSPGEEGRSEIAALAAKLVELRHAICVERQIGLTSLYNEVDEGAYAQLRSLHSELDQAACRGYDWPISVLDDADEANRRLLELNRQIESGEIDYDPFGRITTPPTPFA